ncbi:MAG: sigma 54-interacting transcriptional regulator [Byssovorax sp.]
MNRPRSPLIRSVLDRSTLPMGNDRLPAEGEPRWQLYVVHGPAEVPPFTLSAQRAQIGREPDAGDHLVLPDPSVSRIHAILAAFPGEDTAWLQDHGSSNGVFVNGQKVDGAAIRPGDVIRLGDSLLVVGRGALRPDDDIAELGVLGRSSSVRELRALVKKVAPSALPALIEGPTGTGKELIAQALHNESGRKGRFVALNCAALPSTLVESMFFGHRKGAFTGATSDQDGAFVQAHGGTLFLDEVGDLGLDTQPKLLRVLETGEVFPIGATQPIAVDVRLVAATHVPFDQALVQETFRRDLYTRLAGVVLRTPALSARREDILLLFRAFLGEGNERPMSADFAQALLLNAWPGNVRELKKLAERLLVLHGDAARWELGMLDEEMRRPSSSPPAAQPGVVLTPATALPSATLPTTTPLDPSPPAERDLGPPPREDLVALLERCDGNVSRVAELVGRNRKQIYRWMDQLAVERGTGRRG